MPIIPHHYFIPKKKRGKSYTIKLDTTTRWMVSLPRRWQSLWILALRFSAIHPKISYNLLVNGESLSSWRQIITGKLAQNWNRTASAMSCTLVFNPFLSKSTIGESRKPPNIAACSGPSVRILCSSSGSDHSVATGIRYKFGFLIFILFCVGCALWWTEN